MAQVKICGNTNGEDAKLAAELGADYLGMIFTESKRKVSIEQAREIMGAVPGFENFTGVFCNQPKEEVEQIIDTLGLKYVQFHGDETALYCQGFTRKGVHVIKTFKMKDAMSLKRIDEYDVAFFLVDTYSKTEQGGTGQPFDWALIEDQPMVHERLFLAGGLTIENLRQAIDQVNPFAVDVASGVESSPGQKDPKLLAEFIRLAKGIKSDVSKQ